MRDQRTLWAATVGLVACGAASAASPTDAIGFWRSQDQNAVLEFQPCPGLARSLCGTIVWDRDAEPGSGKSTNDCGRRIAKLKAFDDAWRDGMVLDPRTEKTYKAVIHVKGDTMRIRAFIGVEVLGETEELTRAAGVPSQACAAFSQNGASQ